VDLGADGWRGGGGPNQRKKVRSGGYVEVLREGFHYRIRGAEDGGKDGVFVPIDLSTMGKKRVGKGVGLSFNFFGNWEVGRVGTWRVYP